MSDPDEVATSTAAEDIVAPDAGTATPEPSLRDTLAAELSKSTEAPDQAEPQIDETPQQRAERERDEATGRFVKRQAQPEGQPPQQQPEPVQQVQVMAPPPSFSPTAKAEWATVPDSVKQAIAKREQEVDNGFKKYAGLDQYVQMASGSGTTLPEALKRYVAAEQTLEKSPVEGILWLCNNYGIDPSQLVEAAGGQQPQQHHQQQGQPQFDPRPYLQPLEQKIRSLEGIIIGNEQAKITQTVDQFFADTKAHPYAENVATQMAEYLNKGVFNDLQEAYDAACWWNPEIRALLTQAELSAQTASQAAKARKTADQARRAGASITGGPAATPPTSGLQSDNLRDQLRDAFSQRA